MKVILTIIFLVSTIFAKLPNQDTVDISFGAYNYFEDTKNPNGGPQNGWFLDGKLMVQYVSSRDNGVLLNFPSSFYNGSYHILEAKGGTTGTDRWVIHAVLYTSIEQSKINNNKLNKFICRYDVLGRKISNNKYNNRIITKNGIKIILK